MATEVVTKIIPDSVPHMPATPIHEPRAAYIPSPVRYTAMYRQHSAPIGTPPPRRSRKIFKTLGHGTSHIIEQLQNAGKIALTDRDVARLVFLKMGLSLPAHDEPPGKLSPKERAQLAERLKTD